MHSYLRAIGFSEYISKDEIIDISKKCFVCKSKFRYKDVEYVEIETKISDNMGIKFQGTEDNMGNFDMDCYFPYVFDERMQDAEEISIEKQIDGNGYKGVCEDLRLGVSLIFHLQNSHDYKALHWLDNYSVKRSTKIAFMGLSLEGKVLFPVVKTEREIQRKKVALNNRNKLLIAARQGDEEAMESLTMKDLDMYSMINKRIQSEDVFSIVDSSFMPYGIQCDRYTIIGTILDVKEQTNKMTKEKLYRMGIDCNDLMLTVVINQKDLLGEPVPGRRFKGVIWLQGFIRY